MLNFQYDPDLTIRGLHYDITNGLLIKVNAVLQIQSDAVFRGKDRKLYEFLCINTVSSRFKKESRL